MHRNRWFIALLIFGILGIGFADTAMAKRKKKKGPDGRALYKEYCKPCHMADSDNGEYTPMSYIQDQWTRFFDEQYEETHKDVLDPNHDNKPVTEAISDDQLQSIRDFAINAAADSEHPMTCG